MEHVEEKQHELVGLNEELQVLATTDALTGLKNRRYLQGKLEKMVASATEGRLCLSVLLIDVDHFKHVNDTYGHPAGDAVLQELSGKLRKYSRKGDLIARMGGEELIVVLPDTDQWEAADFAERLRLNIDRGPWKSVTVTVSIGVAGCQAEDTVASLLSRADEALYESKKKGRNRVSVK